MRALFSHTLQCKVYTYIYFSHKLYESFQSVSKGRLKETYVVQEVI